MQSVPIWTYRAFHQAQSFIEELLGSENSLNFTMKLMISYEDILSWIFFGLPTFSSGDGDAVDESASGSSGSTFIISSCSGVVNVLSADSGDPFSEFGGQSMDDFTENDMMFHL